MFHLTQYIQSICERLFSPLWVQIFGPNPDVTWFDLTMASYPRSLLLQTDHSSSGFCEPQFHYFTETITSSCCICPLKSHPSSPFMEHLISDSCHLSVPLLSALSPPSSPLNLFSWVLQTERQLSNLIIWPTKSSSNRPSHVQGKIWASNSDKQDLFWSDPQSASASATQATTPLPSPRSPSPTHSPAPTSGLHSTLVTHLTLWTPTGQEF